jgi:hypothetical protein
MYPPDRDANIDTGITIGIITGINRYNKNSSVLIVLGYLK